ncbi:GntR family transcriptional regulator [Marinitenerispora sediminis]|uniref:GntR family transcriptional regulator n=1 Tax=Marinitenerispora sediminis TaxID=1931232 RepID=A0A368T9K1_9ACTN|nr:GntR family transcriptional regulator [Marinitenerispora sediminis]RCV52799.1 GntR family transcriptional regulator [Marinitenerispora sediminis]RCV59904.1 GntR family transcriptional regulator [Marinitenerispora sediminis]RCV61320.1 GntR family transcriptional regulator [Marinitenerispora sediminis]
MGGQPRYLWVADLLRKPILSGELPAGSRLPSRAQLARHYDVSEQVSRHALRLLVTEGLVESRPGSGYYVRGARESVRFPRTDRSSGSGVRPLDEEYIGTVTMPACDQLARRLLIREGEPLYRTRYVGRADGAPVAVHSSWEPTLLTHNTTRTPGDARPDTSVLERLSGAGVIVDRVVEEVSVRPLREPEAELLQTTPGLTVLVVERTHFTGQRPVETSDLVASVDRCRLLYRLSLSRSQR